MFWLVTGKPGSSKTCHTIDFVLHDKRFFTEAGSPRPVYYRGIPDLKLPWVELSDNDVQRWPDLVPDGAVLIVDEAQQIWPVRSSSKPVPPGLVALETHRHHGWDVIFISQDPGLLDAHARKICNEQFHFSRPFGAPFVVRYHSGSGYVNPANKSELNACVQTKMGLPKRVFGLYKSAEVHTHKFRPPKVMYLLPVLLVLVVGALLYFRHHFGAKPVPAADAVPVSSAPAQSVAVAASPAPDWQRALVPSVPSLPYTAPLYDPLTSKPAAVPVIAGCMSMRADFSDCTCYTQQATKIHMATTICISVMRAGGEFNPYKPDVFQEPVSGWRLASVSSDSSSAKETKF